MTKALSVKKKCSTPFGETDSKPVCAFYNISRKNLTLIFMSIFTITTIVGFFVGAPSIFILCTIALLISGFAFIYDVRLLNGFAISFLIPYFLLSIYTTYIATMQPIGFGTISHYMNLVIPVLILIFHRKNISAITIIIGFIFYYGFLGMGSLYIKGFDIDIYYNFILQPMVMLASITGTAILVIIFFFFNKKTIF